MGENNTHTICSFFLSEVLCKLHILTIKEEKMYCCCEKNIHFKAYPFLVAKLSKSFKSGLLLSQVVHGNLE